MHFYIEISMFCQKSAFSPQHPPKVREAPRDSESQKHARKDGRGRQPRDGWPWKGCDTWNVNRFRQVRSKTKLADPRRTETHAINATPRSKPSQPSLDAVKGKCQCS